MKRKLSLIVVLGVAVTLLSLAQTAYADSPSPAASQNQVTAEITLNEDGYMTVGGIELKALGVTPIDATTIQMAKNLDNAHLVLEGDVATLEVHGTPVLKIQWNAASRQAVADLAARYGYAISPDVLAQVEQWISSSNLDITARYTNEASRPMTINLTRSILVDVGSQGQVAIEKGPLATSIDPSALQMIQQSGIQNTLLCWDKGTLRAKADGKDLPSVTLDPKGVQFLTQAMGLALGNIEPAFSSKLGLDVSLPGGTHTPGTTCGN